MADEERSLRDELMASFEELGGDPKSGQSLPLYSSEGAEPDEKTEINPKSDATGRESKQGDAAEKHSPAARAEDGKFKAKDKAADGALAGDAATTEKPADQTAATDQTPPAAQAAAPDPAPDAWTGSLRDEWGKLPATVREQIRATDAKHAQYIDAYNQALQPISELATAKGIPVEQGIKTLAAAQRYLDRDPRGALIWLAQTSGVDLDDLADHAAQQTNRPANGSPSPQNDALAPVLSRVERLERTHSESADRQAQENRAAGQRLIAEFTQKNPYFREVEQDVRDLLPYVSARHPEARGQALLQLAHDAAVKVRPDIAEKIAAEKAAAVAEQNRKDSVARQAQADKSRSLSSIRHTGGPSVGAPAVNGSESRDPGVSVRADILAAWGEVYN